MNNQIKFNYNNPIAETTYNNFERVFKLIRPVIINKGDMLKITHKNNEFNIPLTRYKKITTVQIR